MRNDVEPVHRRHAGALAVGQPQAPANRLLDQRACIGRAQRHDGVEVGHVPAFFEHIDVNHDLGRLIDAFHRQQAPHHFLFFRAALAAVHLNHLAAITPAKETIGLQPGQQRPGVCRVAGNHQHEGLDLFHAICAGIGFQLHLGGLVHAHAVLQLDAFHLFGRHAFRVKVALRHHGGLFDKTVFHGARQRVVHHHVFERHRPLGGFHERRGRQLQADQRLQLVNRPQPRRGPVAVRLVHQQHQVGQGGQIVKIALPDVFTQALDARRLAAAHFRRDLGNVENIDRHRRQQIAQRLGALFVVVARNDLRRIRRKFGHALEHVLGRVGREVGNQLVVNRQVRCQHKKVPNAVGLKQVADESAHQSRLAHARGQRKAQRREVAFKVLQRRELAFQRIQHRHHIGSVAVVLEHGGRCLNGAGQLGEGLGLRRAQAQAACNGVDFSLTHVAAFLLVVLVGGLRGTFKTLAALAGASFAATVRDFRIVASGANPSMPERCRSSRRSSCCKSSSVGKCSW